MKYFKLISLWIVLVVAGMINTGCNPVKPDLPPVPPKVNYVVVKPSSSMVANCNVSIPPQKALYLSVDLQGREGKLADYSSSLLQDLKNCNDRLAELRKWYVTQEGIYANKNAETVTTTK